MSEKNAYVPDFEYDVFISYSHVDNLPGGDKGWVSVFQKELEERLAKRVGQIGRVRIWRDERLDGSQVFEQVLENRIAASAVFIALTSRGYLRSDYCRKELASFHRSAQCSAYGLQINERRRLLNVMLTNISIGKWPEEFRGATGFAYHDGPASPTQPEDDELSIGEPLKPDTDAFEISARKLTDALYRLLEDFRKQATPVRATATAGPVFLADTSDSLQELRDRVAADLRQQGREVLIGIPPPYEAQAHAARVKSALESGSLAVHLLDALPGRAIQDEADTTYPRKQLELALASSTPQIIWVPPGLDVDAIASQPQRELLSSLDRGKRPGKPYEFVREPDTRLASVILERMQRVDIETVGAPPERTILVETHQKDQRIAFDLSKWLLDAGIQPLIHQETDNPAAGISAFESQLERSNSVVILFGKVARPWVEERLRCAFQFVARQYANRLTPKLQACYVYLLPPVKESRELSIGLLKMEILDNTASDHFEPAAATPLLIFRTGPRPA